MPRPDELYLADILEAAQDLREFLDGVERPRFHDEKMLRSAVLQKLIVMGEAAARLSPTLKERYSDIPWRRVAAFRNFAVHEYFSVDWDVVWVTATKQAPQLAVWVAAIQGEL